MDITKRKSKRPDGVCNQTRIDGKLVLEDYYRAGGHTYEILQGRGKPRARVCFKETLRGDGEMLWEEHNGREEYKRIWSLLQRSQPTPVLSWGMA
jgi:hypothetical protein